MTKGVGFDKFYESGGGQFRCCKGFEYSLKFVLAVEPSVAAESTIEFVIGLDHSQSGTFWAPRGAR